MFLLLIFLSGDFVIGSSSAISRENQLEIAKSLLKNSRYQEAWDIYLNRLEQDGPQEELLQGLSFCHQFLKNTLDYGMAIYNLLQKNPQNLLLLSRLNQLRESLPNNLSLQKNFQVALNNAPRDKNIYQTFAQAYYQKGQIQIAVEIVELSRKIFNQPDLFAKELYPFYFIQSEYLLSFQELLRILQQEPHNFPWLDEELKKIFIKTDSSQTDQIDKLMAAVLKEHPRDPSLIRFAAHCYMRQEKIPESFNLFRKLEDHNKNPGSELIFFTDWLFKKHHYREVLEYNHYILDHFKQAKLQEPVLLLNAQCHSALGNYQEAVRLYKTLSLNNKNSLSQFEWLLAIGKIFKDNFDQADSALVYFENSLMKAVNEDQKMKSTLLALDCHIRLGDLARARSLIRPLEQRLNDKSYNRENLEELFYLKIKIDLFGGESDQVLRELKEHCPRYPQGLYTNDLLAQRILIERGGNEVDLLKRYFSAQFLAYQKKYFDASQIFQSLLQDYPYSSLRPAILFQLAQWYETLRKPDEAVHAFLAVVTEYDSSFWAEHSQMELGHLYLNLWQNRTEALLKFENFLIKYPHSVLADEVRKKIREIKQVQ